MFYFAGSQTTSMATSNMIMYMLPKPEYIQKIRDELKTVIIDPYLKNNSEKVITNEDILYEALNYDNLWDLKYYTSCFSESLRIEPPVPYTSTVMLTEDSKIGNILIKKGECIEIDIKH